MTQQRHYSHNEFYRDCRRCGGFEIRVEVKKFNYMMTDDDRYPVPTQTQSGWIFVDGGEPGVPGDADGDGVVTAADALLVMRCALGTARACARNCRALRCGRGRKRHFRTPC